MSRELPVIFSAPMIKAILAGTKTQTRRAIKPQPTLEAKSAGVIHSSSDSNGLWAWLDSADLTEAGFTKDKAFRCRYGAPGDTLWCRETWRPAPEFLSQCAGPRDIRYAASVSEAEWATSKWRPSIHMPRWASRITLRVTDIRIERLNDISSEDAAAEGWPGPDDGGSIRSSYPIAWYAGLWEQINGADSWARNDWVWSVTFKRAK
jgi:hypothetical protein